MASDFWDSVHLNAGGAAKCFSALAEEIAEAPELSARLNRAGGDTK